MSDSMLTTTVNPYTGRRATEGDMIGARDTLRAITGNGGLDVKSTGGRTLYLFDNSSKLLALGKSPASAYVTLANLITAHNVLTVASK